MIDELKACSDRKDLAVLLGVKPLDVPAICEGFSNSCDPSAPPAIVDAIKHLEGRLSYIDHVRERPDGRSLREKQDNPTQFFTTLLKFYLFRHFVGNDVPTILTEGPSDSTYLKASMKATAQPVTALIDQGKLKTRFFSFDSRAAEVMAITGGCGTIKRFIYLYNYFAKAFSRPAIRSPVVLLIDNDKAGNDVLKMANGIYKTKLSPASGGQLWNKITDSLYVVITPLPPGQSTSCIEDSLPPQVKNVLLNGKTFSPAPQFDVSKHFGKVALASYVQANWSSISLSGFDPILSAINEAIEDGNK